MWGLVLPWGSVVKNLPANAGDVGLIPLSGTPLAEGNDNPLQYSCLGNLRHLTSHLSMGLQKSQTQLSD